jgi:hypothetical protein
LPVIPSYNEAEGLLAAPLEELKAFLDILDKRLGDASIRRESPK